jgi:hypothetical protein
MPDPLSVVLDQGNSTSGHRIVVTGGDNITLQSNAHIDVLSDAWIQLRDSSSEPGGAAVAGRGKLWLQAGSPNALRFTDGTGTVAQPGLYSAMVLNVKDFGAFGDGSADDSAAIQAALNAAEAGPIKTVILPPGTYVVRTTIEHPGHVAVHGAGPAATIIQQEGGADPVWRCPQSPEFRAELTDLRINGEPGLIPSVPEEDPGHQAYLEALINGRIGVGLWLRSSQYVAIRNVLVWDFLVGIDLSNGTTEFSGYNVIGPQVEVGRCTTGIRAWVGCNNTTVIGSRVLHSFGLANEGIGIDVDSAEGLTLIGNAIESADTCLRIRDASESLLRVSVDSNYLEPGINTSSTPELEGTAYDIFVPNLPTNVGNNDPRIVRGFANVVSGNRAFADLRPSSIHGWDGPSELSFGARYDGAAQTKRNLIRNGGFGYFGASIPEWTALNVVPIEDTTNNATGVRSVQLITVDTDPAASFTNHFEISDPSVEWITVGVRYQVRDGAGFRVAVGAGTNFVQRHDSVVGNVWREMHVTVRRPTNATAGQVQISPNYLGDAGECWIDEVWAVAGRYAVDSTQYGERIELLDTPTVIHDSNGQVYAGGSWGPVDITQLSPSVSAPLGVCGGLFRLRLTVDPGGGSGLLTDYNWLSIYNDQQPVDHNRVTAIYGDQPVELHVPLRATVVEGVLSRGSNVLPCTYEISLVGWILR